MNALFNSFDVTRVAHTSFPNVCARGLENPGRSRFHVFWGGGARRWGVIFRGAGVAVLVGWQTLLLMSTFKAGVSQYDQTILLMGLQSENTARHEERSPKRSPDIMPINHNEIIEDVESHIRKCGGERGRTRAWGRPKILAGRSSNGTGRPIWVTG
jgi:hypothetical protein